jgi:hypothetical protein
MRAKRGRRLILLPRDRCSADFKQPKISAVPAVVATPYSERVTVLGQRGVGG